MSLWKIRNNHYYGPKGDRHRYSKRVRAKIKKPWAAIYIGPDYHDAKEVGRFKTWSEACEYIRNGGTPYVIKER